MRQSLDEVCAVTYKKVRSKETRPAKYNGPACIRVGG